MYFETVNKWLSRAKIFVLPFPPKAEKEAQKKQKRMAFQQAKSKSKGTKNAKRWN